MMDRRRQEIWHQIAELVDQAQGELSGGAVSKIEKVRQSLDRISRKQLPMTGMRTALDQTHRTLEAHPDGLPANQIKILRDSLGELLLGYSLK